MVLFQKLSTNKKGFCENAILWSFSWNPFNLSRNILKRQPYYSNDPYWLTASSIEIAPVPTR